MNPNNDQMLDKLVELSLLVKLLSQRLVDLEKEVKSIRDDANFIYSDVLTFDEKILDQVFTEAGYLPKKDEDESKS